MVTIKNNILVLDNRTQPEQFQHSAREKKYENMKSSKESKTRKFYVRNKEKNLPVRKRRERKTDGNRNKKK